MITTPRDSDAVRPRTRRGGFTLVEVMVAAGISAIIMAAVLSAFLMMGRSGANAYNYIGMEGQARKALEYFAEDVRMANDIRWASATDVTLRYDDVRANDVRYFYDSTVSSPNYKGLVRVGKDRVTGAATTKALITNVKDMAFARWTNGNTVAATGDGNTSQLQIRLTATRTSTTVVAATNLVVSARYILRNK